MLAHGSGSGGGGGGGTLCGSQLRDVRSIRRCCMPHLIRRHNHRCTQVGKVGAQPSRRFASPLRTHRHCTRLRSGGSAQCNGRLVTGSCHRRRACRHGGCQLFLCPRARRRAGGSGIRLGGMGSRHGAVALRRQRRTACRLCCHCRITRVLYHTQLVGVQHSGGGR